jgi:hypothetical protein
MAIVERVKTEQTPASEHAHAMQTDGPPSQLLWHAFHARVIWRPASC